MTSARVQPCLKKLVNNLGIYTNERVFPRTVTVRDSALFLYNNHFCLIWKSEGDSFKDAIKESKDIYKIVDNYITEENVNPPFENEFKPKNIESHLTNFIVCDPETHNTDRARPYCISLYRISKISGSYGRDQTREELDKCKKDPLLLMEVNVLKKL